MVIVFVADQYDALNNGTTISARRFAENLRAQGHTVRILTTGNPGPDKFILPQACENSKPSWFGFLLTCREGIDRVKIVKYLEEHGIQTRNLFAGNLIKHPCFDEMRKTGQGYRVVGSLENTDRIMRDTFWVGVYPSMSDEKIDYMAKMIKEAVQ